MVREIRKIGDPVLRRKAKKVEKVTKEIQTLIDDMLETMRAAPGQGLAAPQVGVLQRVVVVEAVLDEKEPDKKVVYTLVNPEVVKRSEDTWQAAEGCLSIPGWNGEVERPMSITVKALDRMGNRVKLDLQGWPARAMQHEIDHLDGVLYLDKLVAPDRIWRANENEGEKEQVA
jgi:peptide deformylase